MSCVFGFGRTMPDGQPAWHYRWMRNEDKPVDEQWERTAEHLTRAREERRAGLAGRERFVTDLEALLFRHDPIGINFGHNTDEYRSEAETITLRLPEAASEADLLRIVHEEFVHWFGAESAKSAERYTAIARESWELWQAFSE